MLPTEHLVDSAYVAAELLVQGQTDYGVTMVGPPRPNPSWQHKSAGAYDVEQFVLDWQAQKARCPQGRRSTSWHDYVTAAGSPYILVPVQEGGL